VFLAVLRLCHEAGLVRFGLVALDGTKVGASAALDANRTASRIDEQVTRMLTEAEATDTQEDSQFGAAWRRTARGFGTAGRCSGKPCVTKLPVTAISGNQYLGRFVGSRGVECVRVTDGCHDVQQLFYLAPSAA